MTKIHFRNDDEATALSGENMDKLNNLDIRSSEPELEEEVWIKLKKQLFNKRDLKYGFYGSNGTVETSSNWIHQLIKVKNSTTYRQKGITTTNNSAGVCEYDKDLNFIKWDTNYKNATFTTDANTEYIGVSVNINDLNTYMLYEGTDDITYQEYIDDEEVLIRENNAYRKFYSEESDLIKQSKKVEESIKNYQALTFDDKEYTVRFPLWETSQTSVGEKLNANAGKSITLATDTIEEVNNYGPAFQSVDCNYYIDPDGVRRITALKGDPNFKNTGKIDVGCLFRTNWIKTWTENGYLYISFVFYPKDGYTINRLAINKDGTYNSWYIIPKYVSGRIDGMLYSSKGIAPLHRPFGDVSYNTGITLAHQRGQYYCIGCMAEYMSLLLMFYMQFATKNTQSIMAGNTNNNYQYTVAAAESNVSRVILTNAQAANIDLYSCVSVGDRGTNTTTDRASSLLHNLADCVRVIGKETVDSSNTALLLDCDPITTTSTTIVSTMHERSGYSDLIRGRNGSPVSNTNGKHGMVFNGVEIMVGGYEVIGNAFYDIVNSEFDRAIYYTNDSTKLTSNVTTAKSTYTKSDVVCHAKNGNAWNYITEMGFDLDGGVMGPTNAGLSGSSASTGYADGFYIDNATSGQREILALGALNNASGAGLSCVLGSYGLSYSYWFYLARLSPNGVGGELSE